MLMRCQYAIPSHPCFACCLGLLVPFPSSIYFHYMAEVSRVFEPTLKLYAGSVKALTIVRFLFTLMLLSCWSPTSALPSYDQFHCCTVHMELNPRHSRR
ncbi:hypothetical protein BVRB_1g014660 [Beta vulgaris subsp. vulgaris]|nr:hypothetical protein BVRB_1g014660 [Beta vulgaris subsp. vulgaris]